MSPKAERRIKHVAFVLREHYQNLVLAAKQIASFCNYLQVPLSFRPDVGFGRNPGGFAAFPVLPAHGKLFVSLSFANRNGRAGDSGDFEVS